MRCRDNADSFYNAYLILHDNNIQKIRGLGKLSNYNSQNSAIGTQLPVMQLAMSVDIVSLAFSLELYIKDLHFLCGKSKRGHNILKLFDALPEDIKAAVYKADEKSISYYSFEGYRKQLSLLSDGFQKWRYAYESTSLKYNSSFAIHLIEALKSVSAIKENNLYFDSGDK